MPFPEELTVAATRRVLQDSRVLEQLLDGRIARSAGDPVKAVTWMQTIDIQQDLAEALVRGDKSAFQQLNPQQQCQLRTFGVGDNIRPISFLAKAKRAAKAVGRLIGGDEDQDGTFFMISPMLLMTNNHVLGTEAEARQRFAQFHFEDDVNDTPRKPSKFKLAPERFWHSAPALDLDFTIVALGDPLPANSTRFHQLSFCPLQTRGRGHIIDPFVNIIQHPDGESKRLTCRGNELLCFGGDSLLYYLTDTEDGASGSPLFNDNWKVIGLHHWSRRPYSLRLDDGRLFPDRVNEGIRATRIVDVLVNQVRDTLPDCMKALLDQALSF